VKTSKRAAFGAAAVVAAALAVPALASPSSPQGGTGGPVACNDGQLTWTPSNLWPPNHKFVPVTISYTDNDGDGDTTAVTITGVTEQDGANAPVNATVPETLHGSGKPGQIDAQPDATHPDTAGSDPNTAATATEDVRAERSGTDGHGSGRTYAITVQCMDSGGVDTNDPSEFTGETNSATITVTVPHDQGVVKS
jgi:hypothetical protein